MRQGTVRLGNGQSPTPRVIADHDGNVFRGRHACFLGGDDPYDKLKRALRADIDEAAWSSLYFATSRPFPRPSSGRLAVKVINHYGDEIMKICAVQSQCL